MLEKVAEGGDLLSAFYGVLLVFSFYMLSFWRHFQISFFFFKQLEMGSQVCGSENVDEGLPNSWMLGVTFLHTW